MASYTLNEDFNGIEITFDDIPPVEMRETLKKAGFRWHRAKKCWYAKNSDENTALAEAICKGEKLEGIEIDNSDEVPAKAHVSMAGTKGRKDQLDYEIQENILTIVRGKDKTLQLNKISLTGNEFAFELREFQGNKPSSGVSLSEDEVRELTYALKRFEPKEKPLEGYTYHRNDIAFENDFFSLRYLGIEEDSDEYKLLFEIENISEKLIYVRMKSFYICDSKIDPFITVLLQLKPHKKALDEAILTKKELKKNWIKKIWEYTTIEAELFCATYNNINNDTFWDDDPKYLTTIKLAPDRVIREE